MNPEYIKETIAQTLDEIPLINLIEPSKLERVAARIHYVALNEVGNSNTIWGWQTKFIRALRKLPLFVMMTGDMQWSITYVFTEKLYNYATEAEQDAFDANMSHDYERKNK